MVKGTSVHCNALMVIWQHHTRSWCWETWGPCHYGISENNSSQIQRGWALTGFVYTARPHPLGHPWLIYGRTQFWLWPSCSLPSNWGAGPWVAKSRTSQFTKEVISKPTAESTDLSLDLALLQPWVGCSFLLCGIQQYLHSKYCFLSHLTP